MEIKELIERAKELDKQATTGPWMWDLRTNYHDVKIVTTHSGQYYVMSFERWGMQGSAPCFQVYDKYDGPVNKRGSHGMFRADKLAKSYPGKEHHKGFDDYPDHPDAKFIVESRQLVTDLLAAIEQLSAELEKVTEERENPKPLTLDELRKMAQRCEGVYVAHVDGSPVFREKRYCAAVLDFSPAFGSNTLHVHAIYGDRLTLWEDDYGKTWIAYRSKPKEA